MNPSWAIVIGTQIILAAVLGVLLPLGLWVVLMMISAAMSSAAEADEYRKTITGGLKKSIAYTIAFFLAVFALADGVIFGAPYAWAGYLRLLAWMNVQVFHTFIAVVIVGIGYGAFRFKEAKKKWYGVVEVGFSAVSVVVALKTTKPDSRLGLVITVIGAVYVSSRGFGNWLGKEQPNSSTASISPQPASSLPAHK